ncbi:UNVERIFIED_ORG: hypothetical protein LHJ69_22995 [Shinella sp. XGS7]|jgi:hypothetical protein|nr:hypothetical protein [Shinella sp. XGS7]
MIQSLRRLGPLVIYPIVCALSLALLPLQPGPVESAPATAALELLALLRPQG